MGRRIAGFGTGHLEATHAACMEELRHEVFGVDVGAEKIRRAASGETPFVKPYLDEGLKTNVDSRRLQVTTSYKEAAEFADVHSIGVETPQRGSELAAALSCVVSVVVKTRAPLLIRPAVVLGQSTSPVGSAVNNCVMGPRTSKLSRPLRRGGAEVITEQAAGSAAIDGNKRNRVIA